MDLDTIHAHLGALLFVAFFRVPVLIVVFIFKLGTVTALALVLPSVFASAWVSALVVMFILGTVTA